VVVIDGLGVREFHGEARLRCGASSAALTLGRYTRRRGDPLAAALFRVGRVATESGAQLWGGRSHGDGHRTALAAVSNIARNTVRFDCRRVAKSIFGRSRPLLGELFFGDADQGMVGLFMRADPADWRAEWWHSAAGANLVFPARARRIFPRYLRASRAINAGARCCARSIIVTAMMLYSITTRAWSGFNCMIACVTLALYNINCARPLALRVVSVFMFAS
jgi:hypothetical protein